MGEQGYSIVCTYKKGVGLVFRGCFMRKVAPGAICR